MTFPKEKMSSSDTFAVGKNLATDGSSNESLTFYASASPTTTKSPKKRIVDLRVIRHFAKTHRITLKDAVESIALSIAKVAQDNDLTLSAPTEFDAVRPPKVDLVWYLWRIVNDLNAMKEPILFKNDGSSVDLVKDGAASTSSNGDVKFDDSAMGRGLRCLLFALVYVDRMSQRNSNFRVNSHNVHRVMLGAMYEAHKFSDDAPFKLSHFALLGGVSTDELKRIEIAVCVGLEFNFYISEAEFQAHSLAQLNFAVKGAYQRKMKQRHNAKSVVAQFVDKRAMTVDDTFEYGLGGSTPLMSAVSQKKVIQAYRS
jgi:hypothetical protein